MIERLEGTFWGYQDCELHYQVWRPQTSVGTIVVTHGIAEHSDCYQKFAEDISAKGWTVFVWDLRGHGRSEGKRGYVSRFQDFSDDLDAAIRFVKSQSYAQGKPIVLFGHSMGGLILLKTMLLHSPTGIAGLALSSPALGLSLEVPKLKAKAAHVLAEWLPKFTMYNEIDFNVLIRDSEMAKGYKSDPLRHDKISPTIFVGMLESFEEVLAQANSIYLPVIMQLAGQEKVVSTPHSEKFFEKLGSKKKEVFIYTDSYHEIFNDLDRDEVIKDFVSFISELK